MPKAHRIRPLYKELATAIGPLRACQAQDNTFGEKIHMHTIDTCISLLPSGSGWQDGEQTKLWLDNSHADKLMFRGSFHHMDENGYYDGYTEHVITVKPSLAFDFNIRISGSNRNEIKDYLHDMFNAALRQDITYYLYLSTMPELAVQSTWEDKDGKMSQCYQAFYAGIGEQRKRFWNNFSAAQSYAADLMEEKFYAR